MRAVDKKFDPGMLIEVVVEMEHLEVVAPLFKVS